MEKKRMIPEDFMTVGQLAQKMGTTVRTLQYYDREGLLTPSAQSEGGRRLYTYKDMIRLHQIQSLKSLGFSLDTIKNRLVSLETPKEVAQALADQAAAIREKIEGLQEALGAVETLREEVLRIKTVDFKKYADIIVNLQMHNDYYWLIKHFDEDMLDHIRSRFDKDSGMAFMDRFNRLNEEILRLRQEELLPEDPKVQEAAEKLQNAWPDISLGEDPAGWLKVTERSEGGYVTGITAGDRAIHGKELRSLLGLRSSDFTVACDGASFTFTVRGYGHGVGLSQYGADYLARQGASFDEILAHYYPGATLGVIAGEAAS